MSKTTRQRYKPEIQRLLVISTGHVTAEIAKAMGDTKYTGQELGFAYYHVEYGWFLASVPEDFYCQTMPECIRAIMARARELKCTKVLLDCDGDMDPKLQYYEW